MLGCLQNYHKELLHWFFDRQLPICRNTFNNNLFHANSSIGIFINRFSQKCIHRRVFEKLKLRFFRNHWLHFFNQCLNRRLCVLKMLLSCSILHLNCDSVNLIRRFCQKRILSRTVMKTILDSFRNNLLDFFSSISINNPQYAKHRLETLYLENVLASQFFWTDTATKCKLSDFSRKTTIPFTKS